MEKETRLVQADQQLTVSIGGNRFRIVSSDREGADFLRAALAEHIVEGDAFLGFKVELIASHASRHAPGPSDSSGLSVLLDCTGVVLARSSDRDAVLAALAGHLAALALAPPKSPISRFRLRTLIAADHAVFVAEPIFGKSPIIERRLTQIGYRVADVPFIDLDAESLMLQPFHTPWPALAWLNAGLGHASPHELTQPVTHLLWPRRSAASRPSLAQVCQALATASLADSRPQRMAVAEKIAEAINVVPVPAGNGAATYEALRSVRP